MWWSQVYDTWNPSQYDRYVDLTLPGLRAALQDASSEIRSFGRMAVAAVYRAFPDKGKSFVKSLDGSLKLRLQQLKTLYTPGNTQRQVYQRRAAYWM